MYAVIFSCQYEKYAVIVEADTKEKAIQKAIGEVIAEHRIFSSVEAAPVLPPNQ